MLYVNKHSFIFLKSEMSKFKFMATFVVPAFPGATYNSPIFTALLSFQQKACSRAPEPITKTFILQI